MATDAATFGAIPTIPEYPAHLEVDYPQHLMRELIWVKQWLLTPQWFVGFVYGIGAMLVYVASWFVVLFTGRYPEGMFNYMVGVIRWGHRVTAYGFLMTDKYPPFSLKDDPNYPVRVRVDYPPKIARWRALFNGLMAIPALICAELLLVVAALCAVLAFFGILFTGRYPEGLFKFITVALRWTVRVTAFQYFMTEVYPPFVMA
jgi:hypothetical protein